MAEDKPGPLCSAPPQEQSKSRPSSADKIRPTTAGPKRASGSRPSSAGKRDALLKPSVWLEPSQAKNLVAEERKLHDVFNKRPGSAGNKRKNRNGRFTSPQRGQNRPSSAERRDQNTDLKPSVWLQDKNLPNQLNSDDRPRSAERKNKNGLVAVKGRSIVDQNGRAMSRAGNRPGTP